VFQYAAKRLTMMIGILFGVLVITFTLSRVLPSSPVEIMLGHRPTPAQIEIVKHQLGLDRPLPVQFIAYLRATLRGDFGTSLRTGRPVIVDVLARSTATFELTLLAVLLVLAVGVPVGVLLAVRRNRPVDLVGRTLTVAGASFPLFMIGMLLQITFYGALDRALPLQGRIGSETLLDFPFPHRTGFYLIDTALAGQWPAFGDAAAHLVLPVLTLAIASLAVITRFVRNMMLEVLNLDYVRTAWAYGVPARRVYFRYALKPTLIPLLTVLGLTLGFMLGGSVIVESVFDWPGLGSYVVGAIEQNDYPAVMAVTLFLATLYLAINLAVDLLYALVDPRLRYPA
jgi:peptide/nickel transport system permease protein